MLAKVKDGVGREYTLEWHTGDVIEVKDGKPRNLDIHVRCDEPALVHPVHAWLDATDTDKVAVVRRAMDDGRKVAVRIEIVRGRNVATDTPIDEVPTTQKFRRLTDVAVKGTEAFNLLLAQAERDAANGKTGPKSETTFAPAPNIDARAAAQTDWAFAASIGMTTLAFKLLTEWKAAGDGRQFMPAHIEHLARLLLGAADAAQVSYAGTVTRSARSHNRARGAVHAAVGAYAAPLGTDATPTAPTAPEWQEWSKRMIRTSCTLLTIAKKMEVSEVAEGAAA